MVHDATGPLCTGLAEEDVGERSVMHEQLFASFWTAVAFVECGEHDGHDVSSTEIMSVFVFPAWYIEGDVYGSSSGTGKRFSIGDDDDDGEGVKGGFESYTREPVAISGLSRHDTA